jgi:hypothetical protein
MLAAALTVVAATAHADPVPTIDEVVAIMAELTDPDVPAAKKGNTVAADQPRRSRNIDNYLTRMRTFGGILPLPFVVTTSTSSPHSTTSLGPP